MFTTRYIFGIAIFALCVLPSVVAAQQPGETLLDKPFVPYAQWWQSKGDRLVVDTATNMGYMIKRSGAYTSFVVVTGRNSIVTYIGRTYRASTPVKEWDVLSTAIKGDRITFGKRGLFLRLTTADDKEDTPYGIHSHASAEAMLARDDRYASMGCIIVSEDVLNMIERTLNENSGQLHVTTVKGLAM